MVDGTCAMSSEVYVLYTFELEAKEGEEKKKL